MAFSCLIKVTNYLLTGIIIQILGPWFCNQAFVLHSLDFQLHQFVSIPPDLHSKSMPMYIYVIFTPLYKTDVEVKKFRLHIQYQTISMTSKKLWPFHSLTLQDIRAGPPTPSLQVTETVPSYMPEVNEATCLVG